MFSCGSSWGIKCAKRSFGFGIAASIKIFIKEIQEILLQIKKNDSSSDPDSEVLWCFSTADVTFRSHWKCGAGTDKLTCGGINCCSFRLLQTQQLEHAWALPHKGAPQRRPINLPKASKRRGASRGPPSLEPGAHGQGFLAGSAGSRLALDQIGGGPDKGTGIPSCAL